MRYSTKEDFLQRARERLIAPHDDQAHSPVPTLWSDKARAPERLRPAAVLFGLIDRGEDFTVVFTERPRTMKSHAGQVALPGGKLDNTDANAAAAALREAEEEVGAPRTDVELIGQVVPFETYTGYSISLFVGLLPQDFTPVPCPREVDDVFETPLSFLMMPENHERHETNFGDGVRHYYEMPHNGRRIWGVTAGMIRRLYKRLYQGEQ